MVPDEEAVAARWVVLLTSVFNPLPPITVFTVGIRQEADSVCVCVYVCACVCVFLPPEDGDKKVCIVQHAVFPGVHEGMYALKNHASLGSRPG